MDHSTRLRLRELEKLSRWAEHEALAQCERALLREHPHLETEVLEAKERGARAGQALASMEGVARRRGTCKALAEAFDEFVERFPYLEGLAHKRVRAALARRQRGVPRKRTSPIEARGDHRILALSPRPAWTLLIDETGDRFSGGGSGRMGKFVGVLVPDEPDALPALGSFHAADEDDPGAVDEAIQAVLDAPTGVLGITVEGLPPTPGERWVDGVLHLIGWVMRLLPLTTDGKVRLSVFVERRGFHQGGTADLVSKRAVLTELARHHPDRAQRIALTVDTVPKEGHPWLPYADALAHMWGSRASIAVARRRQSGLMDRCLLSGDGTSLRRAWDLCTVGESPTGSDWRWLCSMRGSSDPGSVPGHLLRLLRERAKGNVDLWQQYVDAFHHHLDGKATDLASLGREAAWLDWARPDDTVLPAKVEMTWLSSRMALESHRGFASSADRDRLLALTDALLDEDPAFACLVDLRRATLATNRMDVAAAREALARWRDVNVRVPGLQMWGRLQSLEGQLAAFDGDPTTARSRFDAALVAFRRLSHPRTRAGEIAQTSTYLAIANMDDETVPLEAARQSVEDVLSSLPAAADRLCRSTSPRDRWAHHLLLRWLTHRGDSETASVYLDQRDHWAHGEGHPWQWIAFYRAALLAPTDPRAASELAELAIHDAIREEHGPTLWYLGCAIACAARPWGLEWDGVREQLHEVVAEIPAAAPRVEILRRSLDQSVEPMALLREAVPFNFR